MDRCRKGAARCTQPAGTGYPGGAFIALGGMFATTTMAGANDVPWGLSRLLAGLVFSLGLILVIVGGAELFSGNALMVMAWAAGSIRWTEMLRAWLIVYIGNFTGGFGTAVLVLLFGQHLSGEGKSAWRPCRSRNPK